MKYLQRFKFFALLILVMLIFGGNLAAQTPQYYNYQDSGLSYNNFPFGMNAGRAASWLFLPGEFTKPSPAPPGKRITKIYFYMKSNGVSKAYTNLHILMKQDTITSFTSGVFYPGPWDTVFVADTTLTGYMNQWMGIPLEIKYNYDPTKSLLVFIGQCAATGNGGGTICQLELPGVRRVWSGGGCPFTPWATSDAKMPNFGVDLETITNFTGSEINIPTSYKLEQNYPNPFNPSTTIKYDLAERTYVTLQIFDNIGRLVETLQNGYQTAGVHEKTFDGKNIPSGIYFYKLTAGNNAETRKMVLLK